MVAGRSALVFRPKLHFTQSATSRAGPPVSARTRSHWWPGSGPGISPKPIDSPGSTTIGTWSWSAGRNAIVAWGAPTVGWIITAGGAAGGGPRPRADGPPGEPRPRP